MIKQNERQYFETGDPRDRLPSEEQEIAKKYFFEHGASEIAKTAFDAVKGWQKSVVVTCPIWTRKWLTKVTRVTQRVQWIVCLTFWVSIVWWFWSLLPFWIPRWYTYRHNWGYWDGLIGKTLFSIWNLTWTIGFSFE